MPDTKSSGCVQAWSPPRKNIAGVAMLPPSMCEAPAVPLTVFLNVASKFSPPKNGLSNRAIVVCQLLQHRASFWYGFPGKDSQDWQKICSLCRRHMSTVCYHGILTEPQVHYWRSIPSSSQRKLMSSIYTYKQETSCSETIPLQPDLTRSSKSHTLSGSWMYQWNESRIRPILGDPQTLSHTWLLLLQVLQHRNELQLPSNGALTN